MANKESKGQSQDYVFLECDCDHSFEKTPDNSKWINRIDGGLVLPENSVLSVQYAGINIRGSGQDVIEFKNEKIGESEFYEYDETTSTYQKNTYDVFDNKVTTFLEYYKNQDGLYTFNLPYPYFNYDPDTYNTDWSSLNNSKDLQTEEIQNGLISTNYKSIYNFAFPIDNKRYTILKRNPNTKYTGTARGRVFGGVTFDRTISRYDYSVYQNKVELEVDKGFVSPSSVAEQISQQLQKHTKPKIKKMTCWSNSAIDTAPIVWHDSKEVQSGLTCETETFKLFQCATRRTFYKGSFDKFYNNDATNVENNHAEVQYYQDNYEYIGCYNPEFFLYGRSMLYDASYDGFQTIFAFLNTITCAGETTEHFVEHDMYLNMPYNEATLGQYINLFKIQIQDSEFWENNMAKDTNSTPDNSVFLHVSCEALPFADLPTYKNEPFGSDNPEFDINLTNPLYLTRDTTINAYDETNAFGVFYPWKANDGKIYTMIKGRFFIKMTTPAVTVPVTPSTPYFKYYKDGEDGGGSTYGGTFTQTKEQYVNANFPVATQEYNRIGFDRHFSSAGNQCILLWNGLGATSNLEVGMLNKDSSTPNPTTSDPIFSNSFIESGFEASTGDELLRHTYYYDTGNDEIYIGADSFLFNFDSTEARFNLSNCHTARKQFNTALSGFDASILTGVADDSSGNPDIYYKQSQVTSTTDAVKFPLEINGEANQPIYEVSPTTLITHTQEVFDNEIVLKENTIFDSNCGIFFSNFGISEKTFENSLWNVLGFSLQQTKTYMTEELGKYISLNRNYRFLNLGVNLNDSPVYPFTTNANINSNEIISWKTNPFSISYFNTLGVPNPFRVVQYDETPKVFNFDVKASPYRIVQNQTSTFITADVLPSKTNIPFYQVRSDVIGLTKYYGGNEQSNGKLPVVAIVNKSTPSADFMVNQGDNSMSYIIKKRTVLNTVTTQIFDNYGRPAILDEHSSIIYKIEVPYNEPLLTPFDTLGEFEEAEQLQEKKNKI